MKVFSRGSFALFFILNCFCVFSQKADFTQVESQLSVFAHDILYHDSLSYKIEQNKAFTKLLIETLKKPESFNHPFKALETISILTAEDGTFRLFSWYIIDHNREEYYGDKFHYYFGLVQRKVVKEDGNIDYLVIPLLELPEVPRGVENMVLDNNNWLGALYYYPKNHKKLKKYTYKYDDPRTGKRGKAEFYMLLGLNGMDNRSNYKVIDALSFDPKDEKRVLFGVNAFYFDVVAKHRAIFFYSEYAPFSLNSSYVKHGPFNLFKKEMIVYDHLSRPNNAGRELATVFEAGPDGSYDGLMYSSRKGGFLWRKNIILAEKFNTKMTRKIQAEMREEERKRLKEAGIKLSN